MSMELEFSCRAVIMCRVVIKMYSMLRTPL